MTDSEDTGRTPPDETEKPPKKVYVRPSKNWSTVSEAEKDAFVDQVLDEME